MADRLLQPVETVPLEENTAIITVLFRRNLIGIGDRKLTNLHRLSLASHLAPDPQPGRYDEGPAVTDRYRRPPARLLTPISY